MANLLGGTNEPVHTWLSHHEDPTLCGSTEYAIDQIQALHDHINNSGAGRNYWKVEAYSNDGADATLIVKNDQAKIEAAGHVYIPMTFVFGCSKTNYTFSGSPGQLGSYEYQNTPYLSTQGEANRHVLWGGFGMEHDAETGFAGGAYDWGTNISASMWRSEVFGDGSSGFSNCWSGFSPISSRITSRSDSNDIYILEHPEAMVIVTKQADPDHNRQWFWAGGAILSPLDDQYAWGLDHLRSAAGINTDLDAEADVFRLFGIASAGAFGYTSAAAHGVDYVVAENFWQMQANESGGWGDNATDWNTNKAGCMAIRPPSSYGAGDFQVNKIRRVHNRTMANQNGHGTNTLVSGERVHLDVFYYNSDHPYNLLCKLRQLRTTQDSLGAGVVLKNGAGLAVSHLLGGFPLSYCDVLAVDNS